ncbi:MAG TPA: SLBB domain-containing protein [Pyrinomonadaceae bacterium]|nr:SLBB domain-containing protein [Pyrinomonadaceae bacterium]
MKESRPVICFLYCCLLIFGCSSVSAQSPTPVPPRNDELVHFGDVLDVDFVGAFEYDWRGTITPDGNLDGLDSYGDPIRALCRNETDIAADISKAYSKILRDPKVVVRIIDRSNRAVARLDGAVRTPTRFKLQREVRLRELLVLAGGLTDDTSGVISIFRPRNLNCVASPQDNGSQMIAIKISDLLNGKPEANLPILSGDIIDVVRATPVYVIGAVNSPRPVFSTGEITVSRAVASAGGLAKDADGGKVTIFRRVGAESKVEETDLAKIKRGELVDVVLKPFDIIDVAGKGSGKRKNPPLAISTVKTERLELPLRVID